MDSQTAGQNGAQKIKEREHLIPEDGLRCSSSSSASVLSETSELSFEEPFQMDRDELGSFALDHEQSIQGSLQPERLVSDVGNTSALQSPPVQVMERPPEASGYRIPSYVFARKSETPNPEWSTASNESLFSIHTGNMSFTRDQFSWLLKSGELGIHGAGDIRKSGELGHYGDYGKLGDIRKSGELPPLSPKGAYKSGEQKIGDIRKSGEQMSVTPPDIHKSGEDIIAAHFKTSSINPESDAVNKVTDVEVTSPPPADEAPGLDLAPGSKQHVQKQEIKEKKEGKGSISDDIHLSNSVSQHSDASGQSFAFAVLTEIERAKSVNSGQSRTDQHKDSSAPDEEGQSKTPKAAAQTPSPSSWFSCFSRCKCC